MSRQIPRKESDLAALAEVMVGGLKANPEIFPTPPLSSEQLEIFLNNLTLAVDNVAQNKASYEAAIQAKDINFKKLYDNVRDIAEYCYRATKENKALLAMVGLEPRAERKPVEAPGQPRLFTAENQGADSVIFTWKHPVSGGAIRAYIIQRKEASEESEDTWTTIWTEVSKKSEIKDQPIGKVFSYRVRSLNATGIGPASNTVTIRF